MPKYLGTNYFAHRRFPEVGQKQKTEKKKKKKKKKKERLNNGENNGQATHCNATSCGARKAAWAKIRANSILLLLPGVSVARCSYSSEQLCKI